jgi:hypothetical protein
MVRSRIGFWGGATKKILQLLHKNAHGHLMVTAKRSNLL